MFSTIQYPLCDAPWVRGTSALGSYSERNLICLLHLQVFIQARRLLGHTKLHAQIHNENEILQILQSTNSLVAHCL